jgi:hypothetical protein
MRGRWLRLVGYGASKAGCNEGAITRPRYCFRRQIWRSAPLFFNGLPLHHPLSRRRPRVRVPSLPPNFPKDVAFRSYERSTGRTLVECDYVRLARKRNLRCQAIVIAPVLRALFHDVVVFIAYRLQPNCFSLLSGCNRQIGKATIWRVRRANAPLPERI